MSYVKLPLSGKVLQAFRYFGICPSKQKQENKSFFPPSLLMDLGSHQDCHSRQCSRSPRAVVSQAQRLVAEGKHKGWTGEGARHSTDYRPTPWQTTDHANYMIKGKWKIMKAAWLLFGTTEHNIQRWKFKNLIQNYFSGHSVNLSSYYLFINYSLTSLKALQTQLCRCFNYCRKQ